MRRPGRGGARIPEWRELSLPLLAYIGAGCGMVLTIPGALETLFVHQMGLDHSLVGLSQTGFFIGNLIGSLLAGELISRLPPRRVGAVFIGTMALGSLVAAWPAFAALLVGRLLAGLGLSTTVVYISTLIVGRDSERQGPWLNAFHACIALGAALALAMARPLADATGGSTLAMAIPAAVATQIAIYLTIKPFGLPDGSSSRPNPGLGAWLPILRKHLVVALLLVMAGYMVAEQGATLFAAALLEGRGRLSGGVAGLTAALLWVGVGGGRLASALLLPRLPERPQILVCLGVGVASLAMTTTLGGIRVGRAAFYLLVGGVALGPVIPLCFSQVARRAGDDASDASAMGLANSVACLGGAIGPLIIGLCADAAGIAFGLAGGYGIALACAGPLLWLTLLPPVQKS